MICCVKLLDYGVAQKRGGTEIYVTDNQASHRGEHFIMNVNMGHGTSVVGRFAHRTKSRAFIFAVLNIRFHNNCRRTIEALALL